MKWIKVNDELPPCGDLVIATDNCFCFFGYCVNGRWKICCPYDDNADVNIIAWIPMPT
jgi:hypothetical protein